MVSYEQLLFVLDAEDRASKKIKRTQQNISNTVEKLNKATNVRDLKKYTNEWMKSSGVVSTRLARLGHALYRFGSRFRMEWLSIMFGGMMLERAFGRIKDSGVRTFEKIMEASNIHTTAIQRAGMAWTYLKFTVGAALNTALEPMIPTLMKIVDKITQWINKHPVLVSRIVISGIVIGTFLLYLGSLILFIGGVAKAIGELIIFFNRFGKVSRGVIGFFKSYGLIIAWAMAIAYLIGYIVYLGKKLGGLLNLGKAVIRGLLRLFALLGESVAWVFVKITRFIASALNKVIGIVNRIIRSINKKLGKFGIHIGTIGRVGTPFANYVWGSAILNKYFAFEDKYLGLGETGGIKSPFETSWINELFSGNNNVAPQPTNNITINVSGVVSSDFADELAKMLNERMGNMYASYNNG